MLFAVRRTNTIINTIFVCTLSNILRVQVCDVALLQQASAESSVTGSFYLDSPANFSNQEDSPRDSEIFHSTVKEENSTETTATYDGTGNISNPEDFQYNLELSDMQCSKYSCKGFCDKNIEITKRLCSCMKSCTGLGNCCLDYFTSCMKIDENDIPQYVDNRFPHEDQDSTHLLRKFGICKLFKNIDYVNVIGKCPKTSGSLPPQHAIDCTERSELLPLTYTEDPTLNFANIYCALCHGITVTQLTGWNVSYICTANEYNEFLEDCKRRVHFNQLEETVCYPHDNVTEVELSGNQHLSTLCHAYIKPVHTSNETVERNVHCAVLNGYNLSDLQRYTCGDNHGSSLIVDKSENIRVLFDINNGKIIPDDSQHCPNSAIFDPFFDTCRTFICPKYQYPMNGRCFKNYTVFINTHTQPFPYRNESVLATFTYYSPVDDGKVDAPDLKKGITILNFTEKGTTETPPDLCQLREGKLSDEPYTVAMYTVLIESYRYSLLSILDSINQLPCVTNIVTANFKYEDLNSTLCENSSIEPLLDSALRTISGVDFAVVKQDDQEFLYDLRSIAFKLNATRYNDSGTIDEIYVCRQFEDEFDDSCKILVFDTTEFEHEIDKDTIKMKKSGVIIKRGKFKFVGDKLFVCDFFSGLRFFELSPIQHYLGIVLSGLSMICLLLTIITYARIREMRTIAGKMTAMLSFCLLIGQILVMVKVENDIVCMVVAVVNHFVWLSVFCWMSVIALNMALTFWKTTLVTMSDTQRRFKSYVVSCFLLPAIIVGICVGLEYSSIETRFQAGYGQVSCCWMSNMEGIVIMFYVPVGVLLLFNVVCFALTLCGIERSLKAASIATKENGRSERKKIVIYAKLSSIMGFTWIIGFIAALVEHEALWYMYIILNGLQGTFIFLAFVCNRRTLMLLGFHCLFDRSESYIKSSTGGSNTQMVLMKETKY